MRLAFSGSHRTGKTTLVEAIAQLLPDHEMFVEPYHLLEDDGYELSDPPTREDFERQLRLSIELIVASPPNALFDRSPVDFVAYLGSDFDPDDWPELQGALEMLDAIVRVSIETPDRIVIPAGEDRQFRRDIDDGIATAFDDLGITTIDVTGDVNARVGQVMRAITAG
jgi:hypothetical protein